MQANTVLPPWVHVNEFGPPVPRTPPLPMTRALRERAAILERAEAFMWEHAADPLDLCAIARAAGCGVRKLLYCFNRAYGMGPLAFFKRQRLNAVRATLEADRAGRTILDIAADYGFWHLGHFGADYKSRFGVTPSQTRRSAALLRSQ